LKDFIIFLTIMKIIDNLVKKLIIQLYWIFHTKQVSKLLWKLWISYWIEAPLEYYISIKANTVYEEILSSIVKRSSFKKLFFKMVINICNRSWKNLQDHVLICFIWDLRKKSHFIKVWISNQIQIEKIAK
jgi:hypothetical protein